MQKPSLQNAHAVMITVTGTDEQGSQISMSTRGLLREEADCWSLTYDEVHTESTEGVQTRVECRGESVTVLREGGVMSAVVYTENETFVSEYETHLGLFILRIYATSVQVCREGGTGSIRLAYQVSLSSALTASGEATMRWLEIRFAPCRI